MLGTHLLCDIGGTFIKGMVLLPGEARQLSEGRLDLQDRIRRVPSPREGGLLTDALRQLVGQFDAGSGFSSAVISTPGILHPSGRAIVNCSDHLAFLRAPGWLNELEAEWGCPARLINDADAFLLGAAELELLPRLGTVCALVIGTGLGCAVTRDARFWNPGRGPVLLGSIRTPAGSFNSLASASRLAANDADGNLAHLFQSPDSAALLDEYFATLSEIALTAAILSQADHLLIGGGICDAARIAGLDLRERIIRNWKELPPELLRWPELTVATRGNEVQLIGNAALALGQEWEQQPDCQQPAFSALATEQIHPESGDLHTLSTRNLITRLLEAEGDAHAGLLPISEMLAEVAGNIMGQWNSGGRLIYVGAGTSGRLAALDAVEIPCTFGESRDRVVAVIAGGLAEAAYRIEEAGEEDFSAAADMILLQPNHHDTVIGISASGSSRFVRSALIYASHRGAKTAMVQSATPAGNPPWDWTLPLGSGPELIAGSTRMKAGTATKKLLNCLTTAAMAGIGKIHGPYMVDMACLNDKLKDRARRILHALFSLTDAEAADVLERNAYGLRQAIEEIQSRKSALTNTPTEPIPR